MANRLCFFWGLALTLAGTCACEKIANIEKKELVISDNGKSDSGILACSAVSPDNVGLRIANMIPGESKLDACVRSQGGQFPSHPLFASGGPDCPNGVAYSQYSVILNVRPGKYEVKLVPAGSDCNAAGLTATGVEVLERPSNLKTSSVTVVALGSDPSLPDAKAVAFQDQNSNSTNIYVRFVNALNGGGSLNAGLVDKSTPPKIESVIYNNVVFGGIAPASTGSLNVDAAGYMMFPSSTSGVGGLSLGAASVSSPTQEALISAYISLKLSHHYTLFLTGNSGQQELYPPKLWSCDESSSFGYFSECGEPTEVSVGVFHPSLTDLFTDYVDVRTVPALDAIAASTANVLCLTELYSPDTRALLQSKLKPTTTAHFSDNYPMSSASDLSDENGKQPTYQDPACVGELQTALLAVEQCLIDPSKTGLCIGANDSDAGDGKHYFGFAGSLAIGCAAKGCQNEFLGILGKNTHEADACLMCAISHMSSGEAIEDAYDRCTSTNLGQPHFVYEGSTGLAVLTNSVTLAPGETPEVVVLPSSNWKRAAMRVPLQLQNGAIVDFWCASVRAPNAEPFLPNGGPYYGSDPQGNPNKGGVGNSGICNTAEEKLQIVRLISAVNARAATSHRRAVVAALTYASPQVGDGSNVAVAGLVPENFALFSNPPWKELVAANYAPQCTFCGDNPLNTGSEQQWAEHLFGVGIVPDLVTNTNVTYKDRSVELTFYTSTDGSKTPVPVSQYYGIQSTVRVTQ